MKFSVVALIGAASAVKLNKNCYGGGCNVWTNQAREYGVPTYPGKMYPPMSGIPDGSLMDKNPSHWRKKWPEGAIDGGEGDAEFEVIDEFNHPKPKKPSDDYVWPTWNEYEPHTLSMNDEWQGKFH